MQLNLLGDHEGTPLFSQPTAQPFAWAQVEAASVEDFIARYYKKARLFDQVFAGYTQTIIDRRKADLARQGYCIISRHESVTGETVAYFTA